jgi:2-polyprenyl-3-methyl-5-hydroxy-6-metoxy-1,4-benzoquinol methylase
VWKALRRIVRGLSLVPEVRADAAVDLPHRPDLVEQVRQSVWTRESEIYQARVRSDLTKFMRNWPRGSIVMDAGCGDGYGMDLMKAAGHKPVGFDVNKGKLAVAKQHGHEIVYCDLERVPMDDGCFDVVWCRHVLEHVRDPHKVLTEFARVLRNRGVLSMIVPVVDKPTPKHPTVIAGEKELRWMVKDGGLAMSKSELKPRPYGDEVWIWAQKRW